MPIPAPLVAPPRLASVQRTSDPSQHVITRQGNVSVDAGFWGRYADRESYIRERGFDTDVVRFTQGITATTCRGCILTVEERDENGDWNETEDPAFANVFDRYRNPRQEPQDLVGLHAWHYAGVGSGLIVNRDGQQGMEWGVYSRAVAQVDKPKPDWTTIKLTPDGKVSSETAFEVPSKQVSRFWTPNEEYELLAVGPLIATVDALKRYRLLGRQTMLSAESQLAMFGFVFMPGEAFTIDDDGAQDDNVAVPQSKLERQWYDIGKLRMDEQTSDIAAVQPPLVHYDNELQRPEWIRTSEPFDPNGIAYRDEARGDFAIGSDLPASMIKGGGPGDANHWTEWLVDQKFFQGAIAPTMDRICHTDLTITFLRPLVALSGRDPNRYRVGYDATPVIVKPDQSGTAIDLYKIGLLGEAPTLRACGFDPDERATPEERVRLLEILSAKKAADSPFGPAPSAPLAVGPPPGAGDGTPPPPPAANGQAPVAVASLLAGVLAEYADSHAV